jgi:hypothetical protein
MKKLFAVMMAAATIAMVGCKKDENTTPDIKSDVPPVEATEGFFTVVWNAYEYSDCQPLYFAGNYNDYQVGNLEEMYQFEPIEGYENWYVVRIPSDGLTDLQGKGCALNWKGEFDSHWANQWYGEGDKAVQIISGSAEWIPEYTTQQKLKVTDPTIVTYVRSFGFMQDPCTEPVKNDVAFTLFVEQDVPAEAVVNIVGDFDDEHSWMDADFYEMTRAEDGHTFTITIKCANKTQYKYALNVAAHLEAGETGWEEEMIVAAPAQDATCLPKNDNLEVIFDEMQDGIWGFMVQHSDLPRCEEAPVGPTDPVEVHAGDVLEIKARVAEDIELPNGLWLYTWGHGEGGNQDAVYQMTLTEGVWSYSFTVPEEDVANWDKTGMLFVDMDVKTNGWNGQRQTGDIKPMSAGLYEISADWAVTYIPANDEEEPAEEGGDEEEGGDAAAE